MNQNLFIKIVCVSFLVLALVPACTTSIPEEPVPAEPQETSIPEEPIITTEPQETPLPTPEPIIEFEVTYDGNGCVSEGPTEVLPGEHTFKFIDKTDVGEELWLLYIDEGKTFQDHLDEQSEPGDWYPKPSWVHYGSKKSSYYEETDDGRVEISVWDLNKIKEYTIMCYDGYPQNLWFVAPIFVVESLSE